MTTPILADTALGPVGLAEEAAVAQDEIRLRDLETAVSAAFKPAVGE